MTKTLEKRVYEGMFIIQTTLSEDARNKALARIASTIEEQGGSVLKQIEWGRRKLAYQIKKKKEGYFYILYFEANPAAITGYWREFQLNEDLIRFMTQQADKVPEEIKFKPLVTA